MEQFIFGHWLLMIVIPISSPAANVHLYSGRLTAGGATCAKIHISTLLKIGFQKKKIGNFPNFSIFKARQIGSLGKGRRLSR